MTTLPLRDPIGDTPVPETPESPLSALAPAAPFIGKYGFGAFVAVLLLMMFIVERRDTAEAVEAVARRLEEHHAETKDATREMSRIMLAQCVNLSKTDTERDRCLSWRPR